MWTITCIKNYGKYWQVDEGFTADRCSTQNWPDGPSFLTGVDVDGKRFTLPTDHFKASKARWREGLATYTY